MKNVASLFSEEAREALRVSLGIDLSDDHDYTEDELDDIYMRVTDDFPYEYDPDGEPRQMGRVFESILDVFIMNRLVQFQ